MSWDLGLRSWIDTERNVAIVAENSPAYIRLLEMRRWIGTKEPTKMRIPSASFCKRVAILLSSSPAVFEYILKRGQELSE